jgi:biotin operon repressor
METSMTRTVHHYPDRYAQLMHVARTAVPGTLLATAMAELGLSSTIAVTSLLKRLRKAGYDMSEWNAAAKKASQGAIKKGGRPLVNYPLRYAQFMEAVRIAAPGHLTAMAVKLTGLSAGQMQANRRALESLGYDMSAWDRAARPSVSAGRGQGISGPKQSAANAPEHVRARRDQWYADAREVSGRVGAIGLLCEKWNLQPSTTSARIYSLRKAGYDIDWWDPGHTRAMQPCEEPLNLLMQASKVDPLPLPTVEAPKRQKRQIWAAEVPYTMQSIADILGMPVMAVRFAARAHGIGFDRWCLAPDVALALLAALGFERVAAA